MKSFTIRVMALAKALLLFSLTNTATAATCLDWPAICSDDDRFLLGTAEIEGRIDATAIGMSAEEPFSLRFESMGVTNGEIFSESAFAWLDMDRSGNTVPVYGEHLYDGGTSNAEDLPGDPLSDRFGGWTSLVPSLSFPGDIINDHSLASVDLEVRAKDGGIWSDFDPYASFGLIERFRLDLGFFGLIIDPFDPSYYDIDPSRFITLTADSFDLFRFTYSDGNGRADTRALSMDLVATPLPAPAVLLLAGLGGLAFLRRRKSGICQEEAGPKNIC